MEDWYAKWPPAHTRLDLRLRPKVGSATPLVMFICSGWASGETPNHEYVYVGASVTWLPSWKVQESKMQEARDDRLGPDMINKYRAFFDDIKERELSMGDEEKRLFRQRLLYGEDPPVKPLRDMRNHIGQAFNVKRGERIRPCFICATALRYREAGQHQLDMDDGLLTSDLSKREDAPHSCAEAICAAFCNRAIDAQDI